MIKIIPGYKDMDRYTFEVRVLNVQRCKKINGKKVYVWIDVKVNN